MLWLATSFRIQAWRRYRFWSLAVAESVHHRGSLVHAFDLGGGLVVALGVVLSSSEGLYTPPQAIIPVTDVKIYETT